MDLRHVVLDKISSEYNYKGTGRGNFKQVRRDRSQRMQHGSRLFQEFSTLFPSDYPKNYISEDEEGIYLEFVSESGYDLYVKGLDVKGCRLCNLRIEDSCSKATVFINEKDRGSFLKKLNLYKNQATGKKNNNTLFNNVSSIQIAGLEQFWTSNRDSFPKSGETIWWEVWLSRKSLDRSEVRDFLQYCSNYGLQTNKKNLEFEMATVIAVFATPKQLEESVTLIACLSELRRITDTARFLLKQKPYEQTEWVNELKSRIKFSFEGNVSVLILDHGVNYNHPLLNEGIKSDHCFSWNQDWPVHDAKNYHGTLQAGLAFYGDLSTAVLSDEEIEIQYDILMIEISMDL